MPDPGAAGAVGRFRGASRSEDWATRANSHSALPEFFMRIGTARADARKFLSEADRKSLSRGELPAGRGPNQADFGKAAWWRG